MGKRVSRMIRLVIYFREPPDISAVQAYVAQFAPTVALQFLFSGNDLPNEMKKLVTVVFSSDIKTAVFIDKLEQRFAINGYYREDDAKPAL